MIDGIYYSHPIPNMPHNCSFIIRRDKKSKVIEWRIFEASLQSIPTYAILLAPLLNSNITYLLSNKKCGLTQFINDHIGRCKKKITLCVLLICPYSISLSLSLYDEICSLCRLLSQCLYILPQFYTLLIITEHQPPEC